MHTAVQRATALSVRRYGGAVDVKRAADLYAQGSDLRQIAAELGVTATTVSHQLRRTGVTMRRGIGELLCGPQAFESDQWLEDR